jgi:hypothetical protein
MKKVLPLLIFFALILSYCQKNIGGPTQSSIDSVLSDNFKTSDSKLHVEKVLNENGFSFLFDSTFNRYQAVRTNLDESCFRTVLYDCGIQIFVYLDLDGTYESHEVLTLHDGL